MELEQQIIFKATPVKIDTSQDLKDFNFEATAKQAMDWEQLVSMMPAIEKNF